MVGLKSLTESVSSNYIFKDLGDDHFHLTMNYLPIGLADFIDLAGLTESSTYCRVPDAWSFHLHRTSNTGWTHRTGSPTANQPLDGLHLLLGPCRHPI